MPSKFLELTSPLPPSTCTSPCCSRRASPARSANSELPNPLLELLSNSLVLLQTAPYIPISSLLALSSANRRFRNLLLNSSEAFRHLDLSSCKKADAAPDARPIDIGGTSWRSERMDEALTEDEFYSGPLLGIFNRLASPRNNNILATVTTLVLDGLTVPADLVREIVAEDKFHVRILSIRDVKHLNEEKLRQVLKYAVRPGRPEGTPRLKGMYVFGPKDAKPAPAALAQVAARDQSQPRNQTHAAWPSQGLNQGAIHTTGAQLGAELNARSAAVLAHESCSEKWYCGAGRVPGMFRPGRGSVKEWAEWAELLVACEGIIAFDAVLCRGPRHNMSASAAGGASALQGYLPPAIAKISLKGCVECGSVPEAPAEFGKCDPSRLPLLAPVPMHSSTVRAAQNPGFLGIAHNETPQYIARCVECLRSRWCDRCNAWWDEDCYATGDITKVFTGFCVQGLSKCEGMAVG